MKRLKKFWQTYAREIVRFWTNQIVLSVLGLSVGLATIALDQIIVSVVGCVFTILFLCILHYDTLFQLGNKHCYRSQSSEHPAKTLGWKISSLASVPLFLLILVGFLLQLGSLPNAAGVCRLLFYALEGNYIHLHTFFTFLQTNTFPMQCLSWGFFLLYTFPAIIASALGYYLGAIDRPLRTFFGIPLSGKKAGK